MPRYYFITSPGAKLGKTFIASALARVLTDMGQRVIAVKPIETSTTSSTIPQEDGTLLARATGQAAPRLALLRFRSNGDPAEVAWAEGTVIQFQDLIDTIEILGREADFVLVEDSGGPTARLDETHSMLDLARALKARALVIVPAEESIDDHLIHQFSPKRIPLAGLIINQPGHPRPTGTAPTIARDTPRFVLRRTKDDSTIIQRMARLL